MPRPARQQPAEGQDEKPDETTPEQQPDEGQDEPAQADDDQPDETVHYGPGGVEAPAPAGHVRADYQPFAW